MNKSQITNHNLQTNHKSQISKRIFVYCNLFIVYCLFIVVCILSIGCARTVTSIVPYGEQITVTATLRGTADISNNRYFLVLSNNSSYKVPLPRPDIIEDTPEFIEPGSTPVVGTEEAYFSTFFSTWSGYFLIDAAGYTLVNGPFSSDLTATREVVESLADITTTLSFTCSLSRIFTTVPDQIYFDFVAVPWPDGAQKVPADHLPSTNNYISKVRGSIEQVADPANSTLDASLDILSIRIEMQ